MIHYNLLYYGRLGIGWIVHIFSIPRKVAHGRCYTVPAFSIVNAVLEKRALYFFYLIFFPLVV